MQQLEQIKKELGGKLVHELRGSEAQQFNQQNEIIGAAIILDEPGISYRAE